MKKIGLSVLLISIVQSGFAVDPVTSASFKVQATIENGCKLSNVEQLLDFGRHPVVAQGQLKGSVINTAQSWNIQCTARLPVKVMLNGGDHFSNNFRRMKHEQQNEFVSYQLYQDSNSQREYTSGDTYHSRQQGPYEGSGARGPVPAVRSPRRLSQGHHS